MNRLLIATTNKGKRREFETLLAGLPVQWRSLDELTDAPSVDETGTTYEENARLKALTLARWSGLVTLADDSGLEVDALGGAPGVQSARYAGPAHDTAANTRKLLAALDAVDDAYRTARFRCVIAVAAPSGEVCVVEGTCEGRITRRAQGEGGFGYDPVFLVPALGRTFAEISESDKHALSHRGAACRQLRQHLPTFLETLRRRVD